MTFAGRISGLSKDMVSGKVLMTIEVLPSDNALDGFERVKDCEMLDVVIEQPKKIRSKNANAYFHALVGELAAKLNISRARCKNMMICRYGQPELLEDGSPMIYCTNAPEEYIMEMTNFHAIPVGFRDNGEIEYEVYRGTKSYNDKEMHRLIEGTVSEAIEQGLETIDGMRLREYRALKEPGNGQEVVPAGSVPDSQKNEFYKNGK